ncbi:MAG: molybdopterin molybdotransferase MoeA [Firmicutes bacterium]|uniref:Molybdopterin molybdenumtransferase n=1 Tax=Sulfobacillus benefaciens TaxID=453960 RepID=A0A2T2X7V0_9FIRM|nr:molybdopterin molybdotransferase MoeA [Bacillota bacterium]PSR30584.1 MAG: molybdenum cofactor synthesis protein [Sulfobacillus benefaciens]
MGHISVMEALRLLDSVRTPIRDYEQVPITQSLGRTLAQEIRARMDAPPFHRAAMDGYAVRSQETPGTLIVAGQINAGDVFTGPIPPGHAVRIMTGAPVPPELDTVIEQEAVIRQDSRIEMAKAVPSGRNISQRGSEITSGSMVLSPGQYLGALETGILALSGYDTVYVYRKPRILLITTGDELQNPGEELRPAHIYNVNHYLFTGLLNEAGAHVVQLPEARDSRQSIEQAFSELSPYDLVISTGGVSVGDKDQVIQYLREHTRLLFWRIDMHPGKAMAAATKNNVPILALSGNPGAALTSWFLVVLPYLASLFGARLPVRQFSGRLRHPFGKPTRETRYLRARIVVENGEAFLDARLPQGSDIITPYRQADAFAVIPQGSPRLPEYTMLNALVIPGLGPERLHWEPNEQSR